jgi:hypothetical protein
VRVRSISPFETSKRRCSGILRSHTAIAGVNRGAEHERAARIAPRHTSRPQYRAATDGLTLTLTLTLTRPVSGTARSGAGQPVAVGIERASRSESRRCRRPPRPGISKSPRDADVQPNESPLAWGWVPPPAAGCPIPRERTPVARWSTCVPNKTSNHLTYTFSDRLVARPHHLSCACGVPLVRREPAFLPYHRPPINILARPVAWRDLGRMHDTIDSMPSCCSAALGLISNLQLVSAYYIRDEDNWRTNRNMIVRR